MSDFGEFPIIHVRSGSKPFLNQRRVRRRVLLLHDGRVAEIDPQAGAVHLQLLLFRIALGEQASDRAASDRYSRVSSTPAISSMG